MGKGTILGSKDLNLERGQYRIRLEKSDTRSATDLERIDQELLVLDTLVPERYSSYSDAQRLHSFATSDLDRVVQQSIETPGPDADAKVQAATTAERTAYDTLIKSKAQYQSVVLKQQSLMNKRSYIENQSSEDIRTVWCADCQRTLTGSVGTLEIPGTDDLVLIYPGGADGTDSEYSSSRDGQLRSVSAMSPAEAAWNYTMFPGWQKYKPTYRLGKITDRPPGHAKCSVLLDAYSTAQGLDTDVTRTLTNVPMVYKNRDDGGPYVVGDRVVVEFQNQNWESPRVIGFEDYPCTTSSSSSTTTTTSEPPQIPGIFQISYLGGTLYRFAGWSNTVVETSANPIGGRWRGCCLGPSGMIAAEQFSEYNLYQFSGVSTVVSSIIGDISALPIYGLYYDPDTSNLLAISPTLNTLTTFSGVSTTVLSTLQFPYADSFTGKVALSGACAYLGDLVLAVYWYSISEARNKHQLWRMDGHTNTLKSVLADYTSIWPSTLSYPYTYSGGFAFYVYGQNKMIKYEVSPPGPGLVITNFTPSWPGTQFVGGGYYE